MSKKRKCSRKALIACTNKHNDAKLMTCPIGKKHTKVAFTIQYKRFTTSTNSFYCISKFEIPNSTFLNSELQILFE